jgi:hypothetical protein
MDYAAVSRHAVDDNLNEAAGVGVSLPLWGGNKGGGAAPYAIALTGKGKRRLIPSTP